LRYMHKIIAGLHRTYDGHRIPVIMFTKNGGQWLDTMLDANENQLPDALGVDWTTSIAHAKKTINGRAAVQGNLDPCALYGSVESLKQGVEDVLDQHYSVNNSAESHVFNLGHGMHPGMDPEQVKVLVDHVHEYSRQLRK